MVIVTSPSAWEMPKSLISALPSSAMRMLLGLTSRCTIPSSCAAASADADLSAHLGCLMRLQRPHLAQDFGKGDRRQELHDQTWLPVVVDDIEHRYGVPVMQPGADPGLPHGALVGDSRLVAAEAERQLHELGRHPALQPLVPRLPDHAHPAGTYPVDQAVAAGNEILRRAHSTFPRLPPSVGSIRRAYVAYVLPSRCRC